RSVDGASNRTWVERVRCGRVRCGAVRLGARGKRRVLLLQSGGQGDHQAEGERRHDDGRDTEAEARHGGIVLDQSLAPSMRNGKMSSPVHGALVDVVQLDSRSTGTRSVYERRALGRLRTNASFVLFVSASAGRGRDDRGG